MDICPSTLPAPGDRAMVHNYSMPSVYEAAAAQGGDAAATATLGCGMQLPSVCDASTTTACNGGVSTAATSHNHHGGAAAAAAALPLQPQPATTRPQHSHNAYCQESHTTPPSTSLILPAMLHATSPHHKGSSSFARSSTSFADVVAHFSSVRNATATPSTPIAKAATTTTGTSVSGGPLSSPGWQHLHNHNHPPQQRGALGESPMHQQFSASTTTLCNSNSMTTAKCVHPATSTSRSWGDASHTESPHGRGSVVSRQQQLSGSAPQPLPTAQLQLSVHDCPLSSPMLSASVHRAKLATVGGGGDHCSVPAFVDQGFDIAAAIERMGRVNEARTRATEARLRAIERLVTTLLDHANGNVRVPTTSDVANDESTAAVAAARSAHDDSMLMTATWSGSNISFASSLRDGAQHPADRTSTTQPLVAPPLPRRTATAAAASPWATLRGSLWGIFLAVFKHLCGWLLRRGIARRQPTELPCSEAEGQSSVVEGAEIQDGWRQVSSVKPATSTIAETEEEGSPLAVLPPAEVETPNRPLLRLPQVHSTPLNDSDPVTTTSTLDHPGHARRVRQFLCA